MSFASDRLFLCSSHLLSLFFASHGMLDYVLCYHEGNMISYFIYYIDRSWERVRTSCATSVMQVLCRDAGLRLKVREVDTESFRTRTSVGGGDRKGKGPRNAWNMKDKGNLDGNKGSGLNVQGIGSGRIDGNGATLSPSKSFTSKNEKERNDSMLDRLSNLFVSEEEGPIVESKKLFTRRGSDYNSFQLANNFSDDRAFMLRNYEIEPLLKSKSLPLPVSRVGAVSGRARNVSFPPPPPLHSVRLESVTFVITNYALYTFPPLITSGTDTFIVTNEFCCWPLSELSIGILPYCIGQGAEEHEEMAVRTTDFCLCCKDLKNVWFRCQNEEERAWMSDSICEAVSTCIGLDVEIRQMEYGELLESFENGDLAKICLEKKNYDWIHNNPPLYSGFLRTWIYALSSDFLTCYLLHCEVHEKYVMVFYDDVKLFDSINEMMAVRFLAQSKPDGQISLKDLPTVFFASYDFANCVIKPGLANLVLSTPESATDPQFVSDTNPIQLPKNEFCFRIIDAANLHVVVMQTHSIEERDLWLHYLNDRHSIYSVMLIESQKKNEIKKLANRRIAEAFKAEKEVSISLFDSCCEISSIRCFFRILPLNTVPLNSPKNCSGKCEFVAKIYMLDEVNLRRIAFISDDREKVILNRILDNSEAAKMNVTNDKLHTLPSLIISVPTSISSEWEFFIDNKKILRREHVETFLQRLKLY